MNKRVLSLIAIFVCVVMFQTATMPAASAYTLSQSYYFRDPSMLYGDINNDKTVGAPDALLVLRKSVSLESLSSAQAIRANVNGDNEITANDALLILQYSVERITLFPVDAIDTSCAQELLNIRRTLRFDSDGNFKIMVISDVQDNNTLRDETKAALEASVNAAEPDLVIFSGDNISTCDGGESAFRTYLTRMTENLETKHIPWCHVYGNHDDEYCGISKERQMEIYQEFDYCLSKAGEEDIFGCGNYVLPILCNNSDKIGFNLWALDSGRKIDGDFDPLLPNSFYNDNTYDYIKLDQQMWYWNASVLLEKYNGAKIPGAMVSHFPLQEFYCVVNNPEETQMTGYHKEDIYCSPINSGLFATMLTRGDIKGYYCGHEHINNFSGIYCGMELAYTGCFSTSAYGGIPGTNNGDAETATARLLTINQEDASHIRSQLVDYTGKIFPSREGETIAKTSTVGAPPFAGDLLDFEKNLPKYVSKIYNNNSGTIPVLAAAQEKGFASTTGLAITKNGVKTYKNPDWQEIENAEIYLSVGNQRNAQGKYLRVWVDFTGIDFRKAAFGVKTNDGLTYTTDNADNLSAYSLPFYTLKDGSTTWVTRYNGSDGMFGTQQNCSLSGFKGFIAVPVNTFYYSTYRIDNTDTITDIYYIFDFSSLDMVGNTFYMDQFGLVSDYSVF